MKKVTKPNNHTSGNQVHPPRPKRKRVDAQGNDHVRVWLKDHDSTMLLTKDLTRNGASVLINTINTTLISLGVSALPNNKFLITK